MQCGRLTRPRNVQLHNIQRRQNENKGRYGKKMNTPLNPENIIDIMTSTKEKYSIIYRWIRRVMKRKEEEDRATNEQEDLTMCPTYIRNGGSDSQEKRKERFLVNIINLESNTTQLNIMLGVRKSIFLTFCFTIYFNLEKRMVITFHTCIVILIFRKWLPNYSYPFGPSESK